MAQGQQKAQIVYVDRPDVAEAFADEVSFIGFHAGLLKMEFLVQRIEDVHPGQPPKIKKVTACRLVLSPAGTFQFLSKIEATIKALEQQGVLKRAQGGNIDVPPIVH